MVLPLPSAPPNLAFRRNLLFPESRSPFATRGGTLWFSSQLCQNFPRRSRQTVVEHWQSISTRCPVRTRSSACRRAQTQSSQSHWKRGDVPCCRDLFWAAWKAPTMSSWSGTSLRRVLLRAWLIGKGAQSSTRGDIVGPRIAATTAMRIGDQALTGMRSTVFVLPRVSCR